jgi:hypothetical protein
MQLMSSPDVRKYGLQVGKNTPYTNFNAGISFKDAPKVLLQVSPGKGFDTTKAQQWLSSSEGNAVSQVFASARSY